MSLPADASLYQYPAYANARTYDAEFDRLTNLCWAGGEGIAPLDQSKDCTITSMGSNKATDLEVLTNSSGLQVSVTAGQAWVKGDYRTTQGLYFCRVPTAQVVTLPTAHATLPRVDAIILKVYDADIPGDGTTQWTVTYAQGTATAGANLTNLTGAPTIPDTALLLAYVLTTAAFAGPYVTATHILDRRAFAYRPGRTLGYVTRTSNATATGTPVASLTLDFQQNNVNKIDVYADGQTFNNSTASQAFYHKIYDVSTAGTILNQTGAHAPGASFQVSFTPIRKLLDAAAGKRTVVSGIVSDAGTVTLQATANTPAYLTAKYV